MTGIENKKTNKELLKMDSTVFEKKTDALVIGVVKRIFKSFDRKKMFRVEIKDEIISIRKSIKKTIIRIFSDRKSLKKYSKSISLYI